MLIGFSTNNYRSFKEEQKISMVASKIARHKEHVISKGSRKLLKSALVYGANAGGKSNLIKAVNFSRNVILQGLDNVSTEKRYFRLDEKMRLLPGCFEYKIMIDSVEYCYGFAVLYDKKEILAEWLTKIEHNKEEISIFNREVDEIGISHVSTEMKYANQEENTRMEVYLADFGEEISDSLKKKTILCDIAKRVSGKNKGFKDIISVYEWFVNMVVIFPTSKYTALNDLSAKDEARSFFGRIMSSFDTGIKEIISQEQEMDFDKMLQNVPKEEAEKIKLDISNSITDEPLMLKLNQKVYVLRKGENGNIIYYKMMLNHGNDRDLFEYVDESDGTRRLFDLIPVLFENKDSSIIFIDEIDRSLHTNLTKRFLELYYWMGLDCPCQLIATTHDTNLLDLDLLRQDEIWFVERQIDNSSQIYSLSKYKERFDKKIDKEYLLGRYGGVPIFENDFSVAEY